MRVFIVEDEETIRNELVKFLEKYGFECLTTDAFENVIEEIINSGCDLLLLDLNLPYEDGFQICRKIRLESNVPIIVLTSRNTDFDELMSLNMGADDFITKPYNSQILLARIQKILNRNAKCFTNLEHNGVILNLSNATVSCGEHTESLTRNEFCILRLLMSNKGNIIPREEIINELWQDEQFVDENTLNVNILRLRKKLEDIGARGFLKTKRKMGYAV